jgi:hypothetical protein
MCIQFSDCEAIISDESTPHERLLAQDDEIYVHDPSMNGVHDKTVGYAAKMRIKVSFRDARVII